MKIVKNLFIFLMVGGTLLASDQRVAALGGNAAFWPGDDANIGVFPHTVNNFNIANTNGSDFFVSWGDDMKFGFAGGTDSDFLNIAWGNGNNMGLNFGLNMAPAVVAVTGVDDSMNCGETLDQECYNAIVEVTGVDALNVIDVGFGMGMDFGDVGVSFNNAGNGTNLGLALRRAQEIWIWDNMLVNFGMASPEEGDAVMNLGVHCFTHIGIAENTTGLFALGFGWTNDEILNNGDGDITFPAMTFAVESGMTDWATVRAGFTKSWSITSTGSTSVAADEVVCDDPFDFDCAPSDTEYGVAPTFGLGFNYGSFNLDMDVGTSLFTNPVGKITGYDQLGAGSFNITYTW